jgi:bifunctional ADP-heptose synthase (sugar kinase/adenylyltransferase)
MEIMDKYLELKNFVNAKRLEKKTLGFCVLNFDVLNVNTIRFLRAKKNEVDFLIVGLEQSAEDIVLAEDKLNILKEMEMIDFVYNENCEIEKLKEIIKPDFFAKEEVNFKYETYKKIIDKNKNNEN